LPAYDQHIAVPLSILLIFTSYDMDKQKNDTFIH
jgi:hypothetical protein